MAKSKDKDFFEDLLLKIEKIINTDDKKPTDLKKEYDKLKIKMCLLECKLELMNQTQIKMMKILKEYNNLFIENNWIDIDDDVEEIQLKSTKPS